MGAVRAEVILINNACGPAVLRLARRGQSSIGNARTKTPIHHLLSCGPSPFLFPFIALN